MIISGRLASSNGVVSGQVRFEGDTIAEGGTELGPADIVFDDDCLVFAGMGDIHILSLIHISEPTRPY